MKSRFLLWAALPAMACACACDGIPKDPERTLERVRAERSFRVGLISSGEVRLSPGKELAFVQRIEAATGARAMMREGATEPLLLDLKEGRLDLVLGVVSPASPWAVEVTILRPLGEDTRGPHVLLTPIARNGENAWIMLLEREARAVAAEAALS